MRYQTVKLSVKKQKSTDLAVSASCGAGARVTRSPAAGQSFAFVEKLD